MKLKKFLIKFKNIQVGKNFDLQILHLIHKILRQPNKPDNDENK